MQTKHLCVLIHIWTKGEVGALWNRFMPSSKIFLLIIPRWCFYCGSFVSLMSRVCHAFASVHCCLVVIWRERADLLALVCDVYCDFVTFSFGILEQVWYLIVSIPDPCYLSYWDWVKGCGVLEVRTLSGAGVSVLVCTLGAAFEMNWWWFGVFQ